MRLFNNDSAIELSSFEMESIDSLVTDPPAGIGFMGKDWDKSEAFETMESVFKEAFRVLKPGSHGLVWAIPRTSHKTATILENVGFEIRDVITHLFGSGFPKSHDVSKAIDKMYGAEREVVGKAKGHGMTKANVEQGAQQRFTHECDIHSDTPETTEAKQWQGWGTALKPASEHWILIRKPLGEKTVAKNVLKHGTGALNIDASRIAGIPRSTHSDGNYKGSQELGSNSFGAGLKDGFQSEIPQGRFPANLILSHNEDCEKVGMKEFKPHNGSGVTSSKANGFRSTYVGGEKKAEGFSADHSLEIIESWKCTEGCAVKMLDEQSGVLKTNPGKYKEDKNKAVSSHRPMAQSLIHLWAAVAQVLRL